MQKFWKKLTNYPTQAEISVLDYGYNQEPIINKCIPLRFSIWRSLLYIIACIATLGFFWLLGKWSSKNKSFFCYSLCLLSQATHFLIQEEITHICTIVQKIEKRNINTYQIQATFTYRFRQYSFSAQKEVFTPIRYEMIGAHLDLFRRNNYKVISNELRQFYQQYYGLNILDLQCKSLVALFIDQMLTPFEVFQLYMIIFWLVQEYYIFPLFLLLYVFYTYFKTAKQINSSNNHLVQLSTINIPVTVLATQKDAQYLQDAQSSQNDQFQKTTLSRQDKFDTENSKLKKTNLPSSYALVPGDIIYFRENDVVPCDCIILDGQALVDQKFSTGSSYLLMKRQMNDLVYTLNEEDNFTLLLGSKIVRIKEKVHQQDHQNSVKSQLLCLVIGTGFNTRWGKYLRSVRFSANQDSKISKQSIKILYCLIALTTLFFFMKLHFLKVGQSFWGLFFHLIQDITVLVPPTLPTILGVGIACSLHRLRKIGVHSTLPWNVLAGGKIDVCIFQGQQVFSKQSHVIGVMIPQPIQCYTGKMYSTMGQIMQDAQIQPQQSLQNLNEDRIRVRLMAHALSSCNQLQFFQGKVQGPLQQLAIYQFTGSTASLENNLQSLDDSIRIVKRIYFRGTNQKIGVLVRIKSLRQVSSLKQIPENSLTNCNPSSYYLFLKGSPQKILPFCRSDSISSTLHDYITTMTQKKFKLVCYAFRPHTKNQKIEQLSEKAPSMTFLGIVVMHKPPAIQNCRVIQQLKNGGIHTIYASPQSQSLTISEALANSILNPSNYLACAKSHTKVQIQGCEQWQSLQESPELSLINYFKNTLSYDLGINGQLFQGLCKKELFSPQIRNKVKSISSVEPKHIFALDRSFNESSHNTMAIGQSSTLVSNASLIFVCGQDFSNHINSCYSISSNLQTVSEFLKICRAGLVMNLQSFILTIQCSVIQYTTTTILQLYYQQLSNEQSLFQDLFLTFPIFVTMCLNQPAKKLSNSIPSADFLSKQSLISMFGVSIIQLLAQIGLTFYLGSQTQISNSFAIDSQNFKSTFEFTQGKCLTVCLFIMSNFLYLGASLIVSAPSPHLMPFYTNYFYMFNLGILWIYSCVIVIFTHVAPQSMRPILSQVQERLVIISAVVGNFAMLIMYFYERSLIWIFNRVQASYLTNNLSQIDIFQPPQKQK